MSDQSTQSFWALVLPDFGALDSGTVQAVTPALVILIWVVALQVLGFAALQMRAALRRAHEATGLIRDVDHGSLFACRAEINERAASSSEEVNLAWREFDETLVAEDGRLYNTVDAAEFFNERRFAPRLVHNRFLHVAPTALTTLGLLGTFLGLTVGLRGLDLGSSGDQLKAGIQTLVAGAALGFTASLWGVAASLVVNVAERSMERRVVKRLERLQDEIDRLFRFRSPEQFLVNIASSTAESEKALQVLHEKIGTALQESVQHVGESTSAAVKDAIQNSLAPVMQDLATRAAQQSAEVFQEISAQLTASFTEIGVSLAAQLRDSSASMRSSIDYMGERLAEHSDRHLALLEAHRQVMADQLQQVTDATTRHLSMLEEALPKVAMGLERSAVLVQTATTGMQEAASSLGGVASTLSDTGTSIAHTLAGATGTMETLVTRASAAAEAMADQQDAVRALMEEAVRASAQLNTAATQLNGGFDGMRDAQAVFLADLQQQLIKHSQTVNSWLADYADQVSKHTAHRMGEWNAQTERFTSQMVNATNALSDAVDELGVRRGPDTSSTAA